MSIVFPRTLDEGPGNWREIHPAKLASYCDDQDIRLYTYKHTNLERAEQPFTVGDYVIKPDYDDPDLGIIVDVDPEQERDITLTFQPKLDDAVDTQSSISPANLAEICEDHDVSTYSYSHEDLVFEPQY